MLMPLIGVMRSRNNFKTYLSDEYEVFVTEKGDIDDITLKVELIS